LKGTHWIGLALFRGGILLASGYVAYIALRAILTITDPQLELGVAVLLTGVLFLFASVLGERIEDAQNERLEDE
jgi:predicted transporter